MTEGGSNGTTATAVCACCSIAFSNITTQFAKSLENICVPPNKICSIWGCNWWRNVSVYIHDGYKQYIATSKLYIHLVGGWVWAAHYKELEVLDLYPTFKCIIVHKHYRNLLATKTPYPFHVANGIQDLLNHVIYLFVALNFCSLVLKSRWSNILKASSPFPLPNNGYAPVRLDYPCLGK